MAFNGLVPFALQLGANVVDTFAGAVLGELVGALDRGWAIHSVVPAGGNRPRTLSSTLDAAWPPPASELFALAASGGKLPV
jgi:hypothetical protein